MLERLVDLQNTDEKIVTFLREENSIPKELEGLEAKVAELQVQKAKLDTEIAVFDGKSSELSRELEEVKEHQRRSQARALVVKTQREYQAVQRETDGARKRRGELDAQAKELAEGRMAVEDLLLEVEVALEKERAALSEAGRAAEQRLTRLRTEREDMEKTRDVEASLIDPDLLARYQKVFNRYQGKGVVRVVRGVCYGCFMTVPPQLYNQVLALGKIHSCPNCGRIIYVEEV